jgi:hypothetical protein
MNVYPLLLFAHICGVIGIFSGLGAWLFGAVLLWRAERIEQVRLVAALMIRCGYLVVGSVVLIAAAGLALAVQARGLEAAWIRVASVSFVLLGLIGAFVVDPRVKRIARLAKAVSVGPVTAEVGARMRDPLVAVGLLTMVAGLFGIVFLMTNKPSLDASLAVMAAAIAVGLVSGLLAAWRGRKRTRRETITVAGEGAGG